jgi:GTP-sensing pleiotropic transcriptional regulator CodY
MDIIGWRNVVASALAERVGILSDIVIDETLEEMGVVEEEMQIHMLGSFMRHLYTKLPDDIDRRQLLSEIRDSLMKEYHLLLARN